MKLRGAPELPSEIWARVGEGNRIAPDGPSPWKRTMIITVAFVVVILVGQERPTRSAPVSSPQAATAVPGARAAPPTLTLSAAVGDVQLTAFPDWLANEPPPASLRGIVAVRGTMGIASVEGVTIINWTERGISYRLESPTRTISDLVRIADSLR